MADVKWIKIATDIFDDEKILMIESLPSADSIIVIWFKLLTFAGKQNNHGVFILNDRIAYTDEMLSVVLRRDIKLVRMALKVFEDFGMIEIIEGTVTIPKWSKHQNLDKIEKKNEYQKEYMREYREKQKLLAQKSLCNTNGESNSNTNSKYNSESNSESNSNTNVSSLDIEGEEELEIDIEEDNNIAPNSACSAKAERIDYKLITDTWNNLGLIQITKITSGSNRQKMIKARVKEHGFENVIKAIKNISLSDFLQGKTNNVFNITFDWFIRPNNFIKVLEGNYTNKGNKAGENNESNRLGNGASTKGNEHSNNTFQYEDDITRALGERKIDLTDDEEYDF